MLYSLEQKQQAVKTALCKILPKAFCIIKTVNKGQYRTTNGLRLCMSSACIFSVISPKFSLPGGSPPVSNLGNLTKNMTAYLTHNGRVVLPKRNKPKHNETEERKMICYKATLKLDKPLPTEEKDKYSRNDYSKEAVERINEAIDKINSKYVGKRCCFICGDTRNKLSFGIVVSDGSRAEDIISGFSKDAGLSGKIESEEIMVKSICTLNRYSGTTFRFDDDYLDVFSMDAFNSHRITPTERLAKSYNYADIKKAAQLGLYDESFIPETERISKPSVIENAKGHPVHYIIRASESMKICDRLIDTLYKANRLGSHRYTILNMDYIRASSDSEGVFAAAQGGTVVIDLSDLSREDSGAATSNVLNTEMFELIKDNKHRSLVIFTMPNELESKVGMIKNALPEITFVEITERLAFNNDAKKLLRSYCRRDKVKADKELLSYVTKDKGYYSKDLKTLYDIWYSNALKTSIYPQYSDFKKSAELEKDEKPKGSAYDRLQEMIGLESVKKIIDQAINYSRLHKALADRGMPNAKRVMHMVFTGNPGTAKTTVARLFAQILKDNGVLSVGELVECGRSDLVGQFVGWTAVQVKAMFRKAKGSVLFIDEAYSLVDYQRSSFGDEAINTIVQEMENHREDMVVIFAGYPKEMKEFIDRNPGLRSRISFYVDFPNYNTDELVKITKLIAKDNGYKLADDVDDSLVPIFDKALESNDFGNGRFARNLVEQAQFAQAARLSMCEFDKLTGDDIVTLTGDDFTQIETDIKENNSKPVQRRIGFAG